VPWGWLSLWKWVPGISPGVKAAGAYGWRPTTLIVLNVEMIRGLNLPGTPRATLACRRTPLLLLYIYIYIYLMFLKLRVWMCSKRTDCKPALLRCHLMVSARKCAWKWDVGLVSSTQQCTTHSTLSVREFRV